mgnify:CR=1 FL=1
MSENKTLRCICDGGAYEIKRHPFIVNPECEIHGKAKAASDHAPLAMTLEEALAVHGLSLHRGPNSSEWIAGRIRLISPHNPARYSQEWLPLGAGATWPEAVSAALGRPVVARDEAAELRAENTRLRAAIREWVAAEAERYAALRAEDVLTASALTTDRMWAADDELRRLAGGEQ